MGSATYYIKGDYDCSFDETKRLEIFDKIVEFITEGINAEWWWQSNRYMERNGEREKFWDEFKVRYPQIYAYLKTIDLADGNCNNDLAGFIDFGNDAESFEHNPKEFRYDAYVWHCANWDAFAKYLEGYV